MRPRTAAADGWSGSCSCSYPTTWAGAVNNQSGNGLFFRPAAPRRVTEEDAAGGHTCTQAGGGEAGGQGGEQAGGSKSQPGGPSQGPDPATATVRRDKNGAIYLNIRGLYPKSNRTKLCYLRDLATMKMTSMIVISESWLTPDIQDSELTIPGWTLYRTDRGGGRTHGGCAVYLRNDLTSELVLQHSNSVCESIGIRIKTLETLLLCTYRPPGTKFEEFEEALDQVQETINETMKQNSQIRNLLYFGDFNFPDLKWPGGNVYSGDKENRESKSDENKQAERLMEFTRSNFMENIILTPTRGGNVLDLIFTNNPNLINYYSTIVNSKLSDHNTLEVNMNFTYNQEVKNEKVTNPYNTKIFEYNSNEADDEDWERFKQYLEDVDVETEFDGMNANDGLKRIYFLLEKASDICLKKKVEFEDEDDGLKRKKGSFIPKKVRKLMSKKEKLTRK